MSTWTTSSRSISTVRSRTKDRSRARAPAAGGGIRFGAWQHAAYGESTFVGAAAGQSDITYGSGYFSIFLKFDAETDQFQSVSPWPHYQEGAPQGS